MKLGRIVGTVVSTRKDPKIEGLKLYLVQDIDLELAGKASFVVAADAMGAQAGAAAARALGLEGVDRALEAICLRALAKAPEARYPTAAALRQDLERRLAGEVTQAEAALAAGRWRRLLLVAAVVAALAAIVGVLSLSAPG